MINPSILSPSPLKWQPFASSWTYFWTLVSLDSSQVLSCDWNLTGTTLFLVWIYEGTSLLGSGLEAICYIDLASLEGSWSSLILRVVSWMFEFVALSFLLEKGRPCLWLFRSRCSEFEFWPLVSPWLLDFSWRLALLGLWQPRVESELSSLCLCSFYLI